MRGVGMVVMLTACGGSSGSSGKSKSSNATGVGTSSMIAASSVATSSVAQSSAMTSVASSTASSQAVAIVEDKTLVLPASLEVVTNESTH